MTGPDGAHSGDPKRVFTFENPSRTVSVTSAYRGFVTDITVAPAALQMGEAELAKEIVAAATFARERSRAAKAADIVRNSVENGDDEADCRRYIYRVQQFPTDADIDEQIADHYGLHDDTDESPATPSQH
ncbi:ESX-1 secretion-associated protein EspD (plasmid) [Mycobacterium sp. THAF192]|nr:ESX-1 secretion-associated protein EspD [Mycobacterium sp. THAF192]